MGRRKGQRQALESPCHRSELHVALAAMEFIGREHLCTRREVVKAVHDVCKDSPFVTGADIVPIGPANRVLAGGIAHEGDLLIQQHGEDAPIFAAQQADKCLEAGDSDGCAVWKQVLKAVEELLERRAI